MSRANRLRLIRGPSRARCAANGLMHPVVGANSGGPRMTGHAATVTGRLIGAIAATLLIVASSTQRSAAAFVTFETGQVRPLALHAGRQHAAGAQHAGRSAGDLRRRRRRPRARRLGAGRASSRWPSRRAPTPRCGSSIISPTASASSTSARRRRASCARCWSATSRATSSSPGRPTATAASRRAFITTARRGQNLPDSVPPNLTTPGTPRALVYVFDAANLGDRARRHARRRSSSSSATRRAPSPRRPTASTVYAAVFQSGNQTTTVTEGAVCDGGAAAAPCDVDGVQVPGGLPTAQVPGGLPAPNANGEGDRRPRGRPDRASTTRPAACGRTSSAATGPTPCASICPIATCSASTRSPTRRVEIGRLRARRHRALQHGRQPVQRHALREQHRGAQRGALRGPGHVGDHRARPSARSAHHGHRRRQRPAAPSQQAHHRAAAGLPHRRRCRRA